MSFSAAEMWKISIMLKQKILKIMGMICVKTEKSMFIITAGCATKLLLAQKEFEHRFHFP